MGLRKIDWVEDEEEPRLPLGPVKFRNAPWAEGEEQLRLPFHRALFSYAVDANHYPDMLLPVRTMGRPHATDSVLDARPDPADGRW